MFARPSVTRLSLFKNCLSMFIKNYYSTKRPAYVKKPFGDDPFQKQVQHKHRKANMRFPSCA